MSVVIVLKGSPCAFATLERPLAEFSRYQLVGSPSEATVDELGHHTSTPLFKAPSVKLRPNLSTFDVVYE